jgi:aldehyde:ferredoxin oxidoreductase
MIMAEFKGGCFGKILEIDLSSRTYKARPLSDDLVQKFIGGRGLGAYYAVTEYKAGKNPLDEDAFIFVGPGPLNGTACPSTRTSFVNKSPYTGLMGHAETGAHFGNEIKWAGWDGIYIKGRSRKPVWLKIENDTVEFKDASKMWGKDTEEAHEMILKEANDPYARTAVIGPAGENGIPFSCVIVERFRAAGRSGTGILMGDKKLKGISVRGTKYAVPVADNPKFLAAARDARERLIAKEAWQGIKRWGTGGLLELKHYVSGSLITKNFQTTWYPDIVKIGGEEAARRFWKRHVACNACPVHCLKLGVLRQGKYAGLIAEGPEYESGGLLGSNLGIKTMEEMLALIEYADALGLDNISTGGVLGFTTEALEKGLLKPADLDGLKPKWGDGDTYMAMMKKLAYREGKAGKLMSMGVAKMARKIGKRADAFANTVKGKEMAAHDPRGDKMRAYSYCMGTSGGDHHEGQGPKALAMTAMADSFCQCTFASMLCWGGDTDKVTVDMLNPLMGWNWTPENYWKTGKTICTLERVFNVREGISSKDDVLPRRMKTEKLPAGPKKGAIFTAEDEKKMHSETYGFFGWDEKGVPTEATLKAYGIDFLIDDVNAAKKKYNI